MTKQNGGQQVKPKKNFPALGKENYFCTREGYLTGQKRHSPRLCVCVPEILGAVSRQVQRNWQKWISIDFSRTLGALEFENPLDEITLETYHRPGSKKYFAKLFIGLCS